MGGVPASSAGAESPGRPAVWGCGGTTGAGEEHELPVGGGEIVRKRNSWVILECQRNSLDEQQEETLVLLKVERKIFRCEKKIPQRARVVGMLIRSLGNLLNCSRVEAVPSDHNPHGDRDSSCLKSCILLTGDAEAGSLKWAMWNSSV